MWINSANYCALCRDWGGLDFTTISKSECKYSPEFNQYRLTALGSFGWMAFSTCPSGYHALRTHVWCTFRISWLLIVIPSICLSGRVPIPPQSNIIIVVLSLLWVTHLFWHLMKVVDPFLNKTNTCTHTMIEICTYIFICRASQNVPPPHICRDHKEVMNSRLRTCPRMRRAGKINYFFPPKCQG